MPDPTPSFAREPIGARVRTFRVFSWYMRGGPPAPPIFLRSVTGRCYRVIEVRKSRPGSACSYTFKIVRISPEAVPDGAQLHEWRWMPRNARKRMLVNAAA